MSSGPIRRALLSAFDKTGLEEFARYLQASDVEILSTGGSAAALRAAGVPVRDVSEVTEWPEMLDGRVKTLHPRVHGGLLFRRDDAAHVRTAEEHGIPPIDLLYVDLYPFERTAASGAERAEVIEMIDVGGPAMIRGAAKNHDHVLVITDPGDLPAVQAQLQASGGASTPELRRAMAAKAFRRTAAYDAAIAGYLTEDTYPERLVLSLERSAITRYGENPHQSGAVYRRTDGRPRSSVTSAEILSGKEISYNNLLDASAALDCVRLLAGPAAVVVKHRNPCGAAIAPSLAEAFERAYAGDPLSAFGGIVAQNRELDAETARCLADPKKFFEVVLAPGFTAEAIDIVTNGPRWGRNVRLLRLGSDATAWPPDELEFRSIDGGLLVQQRDASRDGEWRSVTRVIPSAAQRSDLELAWAVVRPAISNAIVLVRDGRVVGLGSGLPSRVDSVAQAVRKAGPAAQGAVLASEAFFPFPDGIEVAAAGGVVAVVQPGGSVRDDAIIARCDELGLAMMLTGRRHFRH